MTAVYTHTRPETKQRQLEDALANRAVIQYAEQWLKIRCPASACLAEGTNLPAAGPDVLLEPSDQWGTKLTGQGHPLLRLSI